MEQYRRMMRIIILVTGYAVIALIVALVWPRLLAARPSPLVIYDYGAYHGNHTGRVLSITVLLWIWGCAVRLLFAHQAYLRTKHGLCIRCGYDLRGTIAAGRRECPECGAQARVPEVAEA